MPSSPQVSELCTAQERHPHSYAAFLRQHGDILQKLAAGVKPKDKSRGKLHEVFEPSFDIKECNSLAFLNQKLEYMHNNPLSGKWSLAEYAISYPHSSAMFYETGVQGIFPVTNIIDIFDKDWT